MNNQNTNTTGEQRPAYLRDLTDGEFDLYSRIPEEIDWVHNDAFETDQAEARFFGPEAMTIETPRWTAYADDEDQIRWPNRSRTKLTKAQEQELFLRYNYACYRLAKLVTAQNRRKSPVRAKQMVLWQKRVMETRAMLTQANMALVLAMAKRTRIPNVEFAEMISEGNMALLRAIEKFDADRGFKFSTYACRAILKSFNRLATKTGRYRQHFPTEYDPELERSDYDVRRHEMQRDESVESLREIIVLNKARLTETERAVVIERFALGSAEKGRTLAQVGQIVGLTNERVRQIQNHALQKIRHALDEHYLVA